MSRTRACVTVAFCWSALETWAGRELRMAMEKPAERAWSCLSIQKLGQRVSNMNMHWDQSLLKFQLLGLIHEISDPIGLDWCLRVFNF